MANAVRGAKNAPGLIARAIAHKQNRPQAASYQEVVKTETLRDVLSRVHGFYGFTLDEAVAVVTEAGYELD